MRNLGFAPILAVALVFLSDSAGGQELTGNCTVGSSVTNRSDKTGIVTASSGSYCNVKYPDGTTGYHPSFMLRLAGTPRIDPNDAASIKPGKYTCYAGSNYLFMDLNIKNATSYTDGKQKAGTYAYDPRTQLLTFRSGTFEGQFAKYLGKGRIGLASKETTFFATVCGFKE